MKSKLPVKVMVSAKVVVPGALAPLCVKLLALTVSLKSTSVAEVTVMLPAPKVTAPVTSTSPVPAVSVRSLAPLTVLKNRISAPALGPEVVSTAIGPVKVVADL